MPLIEGVGDEVVQFLAAIVLVVVAIIAWWSTSARNDRYRTVFVVRSSQPNRPAITVTIRPRNRSLNTMANLTQMAQSLQSSGSTSDNTNHAEVTLVEDNQLHFYRRVGILSQNPSNTSNDDDSTTPTNESGEPASNAQIREMDSIVSAMEADVTAGCDFFNRSNESHSSIEEKVKKNENSVDTGNATAAEDTEISDNSHKIQIKLKYLNDTFKEVEGSLNELLKDFKWREFSRELGGGQRVRLIFRGRVLDEAATLRACGLHDRAVVHALVQPPRRTPARTADIVSDPQMGLAGAQLGLAGPQAAEAAPERPWDLENVLMTLLSVALTIVWFFRCEYSNMFTASASVALFGLTVFYSVAIFALYLSDMFHFSTRAPAASDQNANNNIN